jgi:hypothetical protein
MLRRRIRKMTLCGGGRTITFDQPGWWPDDDSDGVLVGDDNQVWSDVVSELNRDRATSGSDIPAE